MLPSLSIYSKILVISRLKKNRSFQNVSTFALSTVWCGDQHKSRPQKETTTQAILSVPQTLFWFEKRALVWQNGTLFIQSVPPYLLLPPPYLHPPAPSPARVCPACSMQRFAVWRRCQLALWSTTSITGFNPTGQPLIIYPKVSVILLENLFHECKRKALCQKRVI